MLHGTLLRRGSGLALSYCLVLPVFAISATRAQDSFEVPLRINMGGPEVTDGEGRVWLGDGEEGPLDPLGIRPDDTGGSNTRVAGDWCAPDADSLAALGFDPLDSALVSVFRSIRWDDGKLDADFDLELPVPGGVYRIDLYFCEHCCPGRHFSVLIQGEIAAQDVHVGSYADGEVESVGRVRFEGVLVDAGLLRIGLRPCLDPTCPGGNDRNPILSAIEAVRTSVAYRRGDSNADGSVDIADAIYVLNGLFAGGPQPSCRAAADINADDSVNVADASYLLNYLFVSGSAIPAPTTCAVRPSDVLPCEAYSPCE